MKTIPLPAPDLGNPAAAAQTLLALARPYAFHRFALGITFPGQYTEAQKAEFRKTILPALAKALHTQSGAERDNDTFDLRFLLDLSRQKLQLEIKPLYLEGRYNKFSRALPQTVHYCYDCKGKGCPACRNTGTLSPTSVQQLIAQHMVPAFGAKELIFHGAGREDIDVRMLGKGRRFVVELVEPVKRKADLAQLEHAINARHAADLKVMDLQYASRKRLVALKSAEHRKKYDALVACKDSIDSSLLQKIPSGQLSIRQQTPHRVLGRRTDLTRQRVLQVESISPVSRTGFRLTLVADAGTYIKEFISGDEGRTVPSISALLEKTCICKELDVLDILD